MAGMYRVSRFGKGKYYAVELDENDLEDEMEQIMTIAGEGNDVIITENYEDYEAELVEREK